MLKTFLDRLNELRSPALWQQVAVADCNVNRSPKSFPYLPRCVCFLMLVLQNIMVSRAPVDETMVRVA